MHCQFYAAVQLASTLGASLLRVFFLLEVVYIFLVSIQSIPWTDWIAFEKYFLTFNHPERLHEIKAFANTTEID